MTEGSHVIAQSIASLLLLLGFYLPHLKQVAAIYFLLVRRDASFLTNMLIACCSFIISASGREVTSVDCQIKECPHIRGGGGPKKNEIFSIAIDLFKKITKNSLVAFKVLSIG